MSRRQSEAAQRDRTQASQRSTVTATPQHSAPRDTARLHPPRI